MVDKKESKKFKTSNKDFIFLKKSEYVQKWIGSAKNPNAKISNLAKYCKFLLKQKRDNPLFHKVIMLFRADRIIDEHYEDTLKIPKEQKEIAKTQLRKYYDHLVNENNITSNSARQYVYSQLASYFKRNLVPLVLQKNDTPKESEKDLKDLSWRTEEGKFINMDNQKEVLKKIRDSLKNTRDKAILLCKISSGMDDCDLFDVSIGQYKQGKIEDFNLCYIKGNRMKSEEVYLTAFSSEALAMLELYIQEREKKENRELTDKDKLFAGLKFNTKTGKYGKIRNDAFYRDLRDVCNTLGLQNITPKQFRRWFKTHLIRNGVNHEFIELMLGHSGYTYNMNFKKGNEQGFIEDYHSKVEPYLLLGNGNHKTQQLKEEMEIMKQTIEYLQKDNTEMKDLMKKNEKIMDKILKSLENSTSEGE